MEISPKTPGYIEHDFEGHYTEVITPYNDFSYTRDNNGNITISLEEVEALPFINVEGHTDFDIYQEGYDSQFPTTFFMNALPSHYLSTQVHINFIEVKHDTRHR